MNDVAKNPLLSGLNEKQTEAVLTTEGYVRVIAGAGSGKTKALANRFAYLVEVIGVAPSAIMSVTFTNKAAGEMRKRIRVLIGDKDTAFINTFHGFCVRVLREDIHVLNYPKHFVIMDAEDQKNVLKEIYTESALTVNDCTYDKALKMISDSKKDLDYVKLTTTLDTNELSLLFENATLIRKKIIYAYYLKQRRSYMLDFDDLINFVLFIYGTHEDILRKWQYRLEYVQVDEFQDVSQQQYNLVCMLSECHKNLFIVGDPDQTIYSWRGANVRYILDFDKEFENTKTIILNINYRSSPEILSVSNSLITHNKERIEKELNPVQKDSNTKVMHYHAKNPQEEAKWIARKIKFLSDQYNIELSKIAILYRAHFISRAIEEELILQDINYVIYSGISFYQRKEIKDILCYLRLIVIEDNLSFLRCVNIPKRGMGKKRIDFIKDYADQHEISYFQALQDTISNKIFNNTGARDFIDLILCMRTLYQDRKKDLSYDGAVKIVDIVDIVLKKSGYEVLLRTEGDQERLDNVTELQNAIASYEELSGETVDIEDYLTKVALFTSVDKEEIKVGVKLMTIHTAKGLEFPYVFVCGLNEGIFPSARVKTRSQLEEERRLAYVAFTRAEKELYLTDAEGFKHDGSVRHTSRFIFNINTDFLLQDGIITEEFIEQSKNAIEQAEFTLDLIEQDIDMEIFKVGDSVFHSIFETGHIVEINDDTRDYVIKFDKLESNRRIQWGFEGLIRNNHLDL